MKTIGQGFQVKIYKEGGAKLHFDSLQHHLISQEMSSQFTNTFITAPTSSNLYITRKLNNMDKARIFKKEHNNWTKLYHKTLKELEAMINVQKQVWDMMKIVEETNTMIMEIKGTILKASINN